MVAFFVYTMSEFIEKFLSRDTGGFIQFLKYAIIGGMSTVVHIVFFFILGRFIFPCLTKDDIMVRLLNRFSFFRLNDIYIEKADTHRARNAAICNFAAFTISNVFCYFLNRMFVFVPGRYSLALEFLLFYVVSAISCLIGTLLQTLLISRFKAQTTIAFGMNIAGSLAINFIVRKYFVFNG